VREHLPLSEDIPVTVHPASDWFPQVACRPDGRVYIVWDSYRNGNYDVYLREFMAGRLGPEVRVSKSAEEEMCPSVAVDGAGKVWLFVRRQYIKPTVQRGMKHAFKVWALYFDGEGWSGPIFVPAMGGRWGAEGHALTDERRRVWVCR